MRKQILIITLLSIFLLFSNLSCEKDSTSSKDYEYETGTVTDIDGNTYQTVKIGDQWWMAENLRVTHYRNGEAIPKVTDDSEWYYSTTGAYCNYDNDDNNAVTYGSLYDWFAVNDNRNIAPEGWHVPSDEEWKELEMYLGMSQSEADAFVSRGTNEGGKLKSTSGWNDNGNGTNESGFSAVPGGYRDHNKSSVTDINGVVTETFGDYSGMGGSAYFWSSTEGDSYYALLRVLSDNGSEVIRYIVSKGFGLSVRCVRD